jgi:hypothetical protein
MPRSSSRRSIRASGRDRAWPEAGGRFPAPRTGQAYSHPYAARTAFRLRQFARARHQHVAADRSGQCPERSDAGRVSHRCNSSEKTWKQVDGVLLLDKPLGLTSNDALQKVRRLFSAAKGGHTGTLDPLATGLLPLCFGEATKFSADCSMPTRPTKRSQAWRDDRFRRCRRAGDRECYGRGQ